MGKGNFRELNYNRQYNAAVPVARWKGRQDAGVTFSNIAIPVARWKGRQDAGVTTNYCKGGRKMKNQSRFQKMMSMSIKIFILLCGVTLLLNNSSATEVHIGKGNFLEADGKPVFVIGAYNLPPGYTLPDGKMMGFNLVRAPAKKEYWDEALAKNLFVWHSFGSRLDFESGNVEDKKSHIQNVVEGLSDHPALLFWESMDEPAWTNKEPAQARATPEGLAAGYRFLQSLDDGHPVYLNHAPRNMVKTLKKYNDACDIVCADIYPIIPHGMPTTYAITPDGRHGDLPNQTPSCVGEYVDKMKRVAESDQAVFIVLQGFSWEEASRKKDANPELVLYPTYHESRFMAYNAILHGANGLMYWGLHSVPEEHPFLHDLRQVLNELQELIPVFLSQNEMQKPELVYHERGSTISAGIEMMCKQTDQGIYWIAANASIDPAAVDFTDLPSEMADVDRMTVLGENRTVVIENGRFFDEFEGLDVHVYWANSAK